MQQNPVTLMEKLRVHFREVFNVLDIIGIATYLASFFLKVIVLQDNESVQFQCSSAVKR